MFGSGLSLELCEEFGDRQLDQALAQYGVERLDGSLIGVNEGLFCFRIEDPGNRNAQREIVTGAGHEIREPVIRRNHCCPAKLFRNEIKVFE